MDELSQNQGLTQFEGPSYDDVNSSDLFTEDEEYMQRIGELEAYLDMVNNLAKPGCSQEVLKVALNSMSSLVKILDSMSSSTSKLLASL